MGSRPPDGSSLCVSPCAAFFGSCKYTIFSYIPVLPFTIFVQKQPQKTFLLLI